MSADTCNRSLDLDLKDSDRIRSRIKDDQFASDLYGILCNNKFWHDDNDGEFWSITRRGSAALVAEIRNDVKAARWTEYYLDYYCTGNEGVRTKELADILASLGWSVSNI